MATLDAGETVHVRVVDIAPARTGPVIEFEVLDEGPHLGEHLLGQPADHLPDWVGAILDHDGTPMARGVPMETILHRSCRAVIGVTGHIRHRRVVQNVLPA